MLVIIIIFLTLWLFLGWLAITLTDNAWNVHWYQTFGEHYLESTSYINNTILRNILVIGGLFTFFIFICNKDTWRKGSGWSPRDSNWMLFYNNKKVEERYSIKSNS